MKSRRLHVVNFPTLLVSSLIQEIKTRAKITALLIENERVFALSTGAAQKTGGQFYGIYLASHGGHDPANCYRQCGKKSWPPLTAGRQVVRSRLTVCR